MSKCNTATILITGATGSVGSQLAALLAAQNIPFRAMVRSVQVARRLPALKNAELVAGDFNDKASIAGALQELTRRFC